MTTSVLIPTWRRPAELVRCLRAVQAQTRPAAQVIVTVRDDDESTHAALAEMSGIEVVLVSPGPLTAAMNAGLARTTGELVALTDDDAEPRPDWLERLAAPFADPSIGGVGGRDWQPHERRDVPKVGRLAWFGRVVGNHHLGSGPAREVELLKGVNCCFRGDLLRRIGFDRQLRGRANVSHWEMSLCFAVLRDGYRLIYDPKIAVDHHVAIRHDGDVNARGGFEATSYIDSVHNETLAIVRQLSWPGRAAFGIWCVAVGTRECPGVVQVIRLMPRVGFGPALLRAMYSARGRWAGIASSLKANHE